MAPQIQWMYTDYLPDPEFSSEYLSNENSALLSSTLSFTPRPMHNGQLLGCRVYYPNTTLVYERLISLDIKCKLNTIEIKICWSKLSFESNIFFLYPIKPFQINHLHKSNAKFQNNFFHCGNKNKEKNKKIKSLHHQHFHTNAYTHPSMSDELW